MASEKLLNYIRNAPKITFYNLKDIAPKVKKPASLNRKKRGLGHRGMSQFQNWMPLGSLEKRTPFYLTVPKEPYNSNSYVKPHYTRLSLLELQRLIDLKRIDASKPIDLTSIYNTKLYNIDDINDENYGIDLTDEGIDKFCSPINLEVQYASETAIAAIEKAGGVVTTRYYDLFSLYAKRDPLAFFKKGFPIPFSRLPPKHLLDYYTNAENRGYLSDPEDLAKCRIILSQKFGYSLPDLTQSSNRNVLKMCKDPDQIFHHIKPGTLVNLVDRKMYTPVESRHE